MNPKQKGDIAVAQAIHFYMTKGYEVCLPIGDKQPYDLVIDRIGTLYRVQVKYAGFYNRVKQHKVALRVTGGNRSRNSARNYSKNDFDELFVYTANGRIFIFPWTEVLSTNEINVEHVKYSSYEMQG